MLLLAASQIFCTGIAFNAWADIEEPSDAPADHGADCLTGFDVVNSDTDSADENTVVEQVPEDEPIAEVNPAGSENSVYVNEPVR